MPELRRATIEVTYDPHDYTEVDGETWAYTLRMGGIDADEVTVVSERSAGERA